MSYSAQALRRQTLTASAAVSTTARAMHKRRVEVRTPAWLAVAGALGLSLMGVAAIATTEPALATRQIAYLCVSLLAAAVITLPHFRLLQRVSVPLMLAVLALLVFVMIPFVPEAIVRPRNGARRWISLGVTDFQPSELAKIAYIIALASYLRYRKNYRRILGLLLPLALTFVPMALVLVEPDLGTALLFLPTLFAMLVAAGAKLRHLALIVVIGLASAPALYPILQTHQRNRIDALYYQIIGDDRHVQGIGLQGDKAMMLAGAGGLTGVGRAKAADLLRHNRLPEEHNDMVFAVVCCRWGALGAILQWGLHLAITAGGLVTAARTRDPFGRLIVVGTVAALFAQMAINTGMTLGLMPITGLTLPFVSAGGSSLLTAWLMIGVVLNVGMRPSQYLAPEPFDWSTRDAE
jgi:cell division protein FtsW (lipid II flippase)